jgi:hypothetical protein
VPTLAAELAERELDVQETTVSNDRDVIRCYINPHIGARQLYDIDKRIIHKPVQDAAAGGRRSARCPRRWKSVASGRWHPPSQQGGRGTSVSQS